MNYNKKYNQWAKKVMTHLTCSCRNGDKCPEGYCYYAVLNVINGKSIHFTCGRPVNIIKDKKN